MNNIIAIKNRNIFQSNEIMGVTYWLLNDDDEKYRLNVNQTKILKIAMAMVNPKETLQEEYTFYDSEFMDIIGIENQTAQYIDIPKFLTELMKNDTFKSIDSNGNMKIIHIFDYVMYNPKKRTVKFSFSNVMLKNLTKLDSNYTKYRLGNILNFKSVYSINLYELFKKELKGKQNKIMTIEISKLKEWLGLSNKYSRYYDFKTKVLDKVQKEINSLNDISFKYEEMRRGKKVIEIKFIVKGNNKSKDEIAAGVVAPETQTQQKQDLIKEVQAMFTQHKIVKNIVGYMRKLVKGFNKPQENKTSTFNNFKQRDYDFKELERKLLGLE